jgi:hypothetical protein
VDRVGPEVKADRVVREDPAVLDRAVQVVREGLVVAAKALNQTS